MDKQTRKQKILEVLNSTGGSLSSAELASSIRVQPVDIGHALRELYAVGAIAKCWTRQLRRTPDRDTRMQRVMVYSITRHGKELAEQHGRVSHASGSKEGTQAPEWACVAGTS